MNFLKNLCLGLFGLTTVACGASVGDDEPLQIEVVGQQFIAEGVVDSSTPAVIKSAIADNPNVRELVLKWVPGSADDEANLRTARMVRGAGLTTVVPEGGMVASGGTDLFLAGTERIVGQGACVGVHSWASQGILGDEVQGRDVPRTSEAHTPYLSYYAEIGVDEAFYWYTLDAADADGMHWMTNTEIERFDMATSPLSKVEANPQRCDDLA